MIHFSVYKSLAYWNMLTLHHPFQQLQSLPLRCKYSKWSKWSKCATSSNSRNGPNGRPFYYFNLLFGLFTFENWTFYFFNLDGKVQLIGLFGPNIRYKNNWTKKSIGEQFFLPFFGPIIYLFESKKKGPIFIQKSK